MHRHPVHFPDLKIRPDLVIWKRLHGIGLGEASGEEGGTPGARSPSAPLRWIGIFVGLVGLVVGVRLLDPLIARFDLSYGGGSDAVAAEVSPVGLDDRLFLDQIPEGKPHEFVLVTVTGYSSRPCETDATPAVTATQQPARPGTLALSRDLLRTFIREAPFDFGDRVLIPGMGIYIVEDTMHPQWRNRADIWFRDAETARRWGHRHVYLVQVEADEPLLVTEQWHPSGSE